MAEPEDLKSYDLAPLLVAVWGFHNSEIAARIALECGIVMVIKNWISDHFAGALSLPPGGTVRDSKVEVEG